MGCVCCVLCLGCSLAIGKLCWLVCTGADLVQGLGLAL